MDKHQDESPYPRYFGPTGNAYPGGVYLVKQDERGVDGEMPMIRRLMAHADTGCFYIGLTLWRDPPREYPPFHSGSANTGMKLDLEEAAALWHSLGEFLATQSEADWRMSPDRAI